MEFIPILGKTEYISMSYGIVPLYRLSAHEIILFDSGTEKSSELMDLLRQSETHVHSILCTHLHPDHIANSQELYESHGSVIYGPTNEVETSRAKWDWTHPISTFTNEPAVEIAGHSFPIFYTPGHSAGHLCYATPDGVFIAGDAFMTDGPLKHSKIPYMEDIDQSIISMEIIRETNYPLYAAAHKGIVSRESLDRLLDDNIQKELDLYAILRLELEDGISLDDLITRFIKAAGVYSQEMVDKDYVRLTSKMRVLALASAGEYEIKNDIVHISFPEKKKTI